MHAMPVELVERTLEHRRLPQQRALRAADLLGHAVGGGVEFTVGGDGVDQFGALLHPAPHRLQRVGGAADAVLGAAEHGLVEVLAQLVEARQQMLQIGRADAACRLPGRELRGHVGQIVTVGVELQQQTERRQRLPARGTDAVALRLRLPQQQAVVAQAIEHGAELHRVQIGEVFAQFLRAPVRRLAARAQRAQHQQPHHHAVLAAVEQRGERADLLARRHQRMQVRQVGGIDAVAQIVLERSDGGRPWWWGAMVGVRAATDNS